MPATAQTSLLRSCGSPAVRRILSSRAAGWFGAAHCCSADAQLTTACTGPSSHHHFDNPLLACRRGTSPLNLINWQTDIDLSLSDQDGMGRVHDGFYDALFGEARNKRSLCDHQTTEKSTVWDAALAAVTEVRIFHQVPFVSSSDSNCCSTRRATSAICATTRPLRRPLCGTPRCQPT